MQSVFQGRPRTSLDPSNHGVEDDTLEIASAGTGGPALQLPYLNTIQRLFGRHDISDVEAHIGGRATAACRTLEAEAYTSGIQVAFAAVPDLHTSAHEAAHVIQQGNPGLQLNDVLGATDDPHEQHADAVADLVTRGGSAETLLDQHSGSGSSSGPIVVQRKPGDGGSGKAGKPPAYQWNPNAPSSSNTVPLKTATTYLVTPQQPGSSGPTAPDAEQSKALGLIAQLAQQLPPKSKHFPHVTPEEFTKQLKDRVLHPDALNQGKDTDFCWASACMSYTYGAKPVAMVKAMFSLYTTGTFLYAAGGATDLALTPSKKARTAVGTDVFKGNTDNSGNAPGSGLSGNKVDQMLFMTLADVNAFRGFTNLDINYDRGDQEDPKWAGRSFEATIRLWEAFGFDITTKGASISLKRLFQSPTASASDDPGLVGWAASELAGSKDIVLFINGPIFRREETAKISTVVGTHFIRVRTLKQDAKAGKVTLEYLDYGHEEWRTETMPLQRLRYATHGVISIDFPHPK